MSQPATPATIRVMFDMLCGESTELNDVWQERAIDEPREIDYGVGVIYVSARGLLVELPSDPAEADALAAKIRALVEEEQKAGAQ